VQARDGSLGGDGLKRGNLQPFAGAIAMPDYQPYLFLAALTSARERRQWPVWISRLKGSRTREKPPIRN